ncbi:TetR/AcrR family transcriptional regulator [Tardiphaga sp. OK245]|uniref:TetR/AcrR family transcriptional regulator n=1 Tax=Tardiphaga sp. OK245 TaxID=1855306 RepID=UPI0008A7492F|nr:TetR/AcrR family transcriptional regulator [Tardiphaga sp. OK245]SEI22145.1 transcriptional regulator, TetR family [Tardiphaga sp. OK245]
MGRRQEVSNERILEVARRCFLLRGAGVSAVEIAGELGVSHTTIFNRFGSKEALMIAALGVPDQIEWASVLEKGPDNRPVFEQLVQHGKVVAAYFQNLQAGLAVLHAAGIPNDKIFPDQTADSAPAKAFMALVAWLRVAQSQGRIGKCDVETLASTILGALYNWAQTASVCGHSTTRDDSESHVERFIELLWNGIGVE